VGKALATEIERALHERLERVFAHERGSAARGLDMRALGFDIKVTSLKEPQSSDKYGSPLEKLFGLP
jgi:hypothetical protein